jgi:hypothetical protein
MMRKKNRYDDDDDYYYISEACLENGEYGCRDPSRWPRGTLYSQKLAITSPTSGGRSVGIGHSRTKATELLLLLLLLYYYYH